MSDEQQNKDQLQPTAVEDWPQPAREVTVSLPSGATATIKRPSLTGAVAAGGVPAAVRRIFREKADPDSGRLQDLTDKEAQLVSDFILALSFVAPPVSLTRRKGYLHVSRISDDDKLFVAQKLRLED